MRNGTNSTETPPASEHSAPCCLGGERQAGIGWKKRSSMRSQGFSFVLIVWLPLWRGNRACRETSALLVL
uniref:Uncharacterized protein n=1 Tax=Anguilla anguilla TaxID=7936 RepID=A0A0E9WVA4_ANGAN